MRKPGRKGVGKSGWAIQAQLKMYMWLGLKRDAESSLAGLPEGYEIVADRFGHIREVVYRSTTTFDTSFAYLKF